MSGQYGIPEGGASVAAVPVRSASLTSPSACIAAKSGKVVVHLFDMLWDWRQRRYERNLLAGMSARDLADLGLNRADVVTEVEKPFWRG